MIIFQIVPQIFFLMINVWEYSLSLFRMTLNLQETSIYEHQLKVTINHEPVNKHSLASYVMFKKFSCLKAIIMVKNLEENINVCISHLILFYKSLAPALT